MESFAYGEMVPMPTRPPVKAKRELPSTAIDDDDVSTSDTWNGAETVEEASEMKLPNVASPLDVIVPIPVMFPSVSISQSLVSIAPVSPPSPSANNPFASNTPSTMNVDEADRMSETWNGAETVELADEMNPESKVES